MILETRVREDVLENVAILEGEAKRTGVRGRNVLMGAPE